MVHDMEPEDEPIDVLRRKYLGGERADVMVTGHTHFERLAWRDIDLQAWAVAITAPTRAVVLHIDGVRDCSFSGRLFEAHTVTVCLLF